jgi:type II secretory pathway pseudopilin PulG
MKHRSPAGRRAGFTFLEMVTALALIMLLASMLFPVFVRSRESARSTCCRSNLQQIGQALHLYAQDYNGRFPPAGPGWSGALLSYTKNFQVYRCPTGTLDTPLPIPVDPSPGALGGNAAAPVTIFSSYQYRGGLRNDDPGDLPIAADWRPWHREGGNVLYLGGYTKWEEATALPQLTTGPGPSAGRSAAR